MNPTQRVVYSAGNGEVEVYEVQIPPQWDGQTLGELLESLKQCYPVALSRAGRSSLPDRDIELRAGDLLNFSSTFEGMRAMMTRLSQTSEEK